MKIVSLVPSLTQLLFDLGLGNQIVGRTRFCVHPARQLISVPVVGGTKNPDNSKIRALNPDLVIMNKEENRKEDADAIRKFTKVLVTDIITVEDAVNTILSIGFETGSAARARKLVDGIRSLIPKTPPRNVKTAYFIWKDPWMTAGNDTYIHDVMQKWGFENVFGHLLRYPEIQESEIHKSKPELVMLSSEPYPFKEKHASELKRILPGAAIELVNGEWFSWYGSGMLQAFAALNRRSVDE